jgi:hypothetical protein
MLRSHSNHVQFVSFLIVGFDFGIGKRAVILFVSLAMNRTIAIVANV